MTDDTTSVRVSEVAGGRVRFAVEHTLLDNLGDGDWFLGPDAALYEVTTPAAAHPRGWTNVLNLSITDTDADARAATGANPSDDPAGPREGFFAYSVPVTVDRVTAVLGTADEPAAGSGSGSGSGQVTGASVVSTLLRRWAGTDRGPLRYDRAPVPPRPPAPAGGTTA